MSSDNLLEAVTGLVQGFGSVYTPLQVELNKKQIDRKFNSTSVGDFEKLAQYDTGIQDKNRLLTSDQMSIMMESRKLKSEHDKVREQREYDVQKYHAEHPTIETLYPDQFVRPKKFRMPGMEKMTVDEAIKYKDSETSGSLALSDKESQHQDKLEEDYRKSLEKGVAARSGDLGVQNAKVSQAVHLRNLMDQFYDPKRDEYKIPNSQYEELAIGMASLVGGGTAPTESMKAGIRQRTAKGDIGGALTYITGVNHSGSTKDIFKTLADSIDRQGLTSEELRNNYYKEMSTMRPTRLNPDRAEALEKVNLGASYKDYLEKSPSRKNVSPPGMGQVQGFNASQGLFSDPDKQKRYEAWKSRKQ